MSWRIRRAVWFMGALLILGSLVAMVQHMKEPTSSPAETSSAFSASTQKPIAIGAEASIAPTAGGPAVIAEQSNPKTLMSKASQISALIASGRAEDMFQAFKIAEACHNSKQKFYFPPPEDGMPSQPIMANTAKRESELCGDLTAVQLSPRLSWLERAAKEGVPGALDAAMLYGPGGSEPSPIFTIDAESKFKSYVYKGAENADFSSLLALANAHRSGQWGAIDMKSSLKYMYAAMLVYENGERKFHRHEDVLEKYSSVMSAEDYKEALEQGLKLSKGRGNNP